MLKHLTILNVKFDKNINPDLHHYNANNGCVYSLEGDCKA